MQGIPQGPHSQGGSQKPTLSWQGPSTQPKPTQPSGGNKPPQQVPKSSNKPDGSKSNMTTYAGIFIAGLIVGVLVGWGALSGSGSVATSTNSTSGTTSNTNTSGGDSTGSSMSATLAGLTVASGQEAGPTVAIASVSVDKPTWVIIYDDAGGLPGRALGAQLFYPVSQGGESSGTVSLIRNSLSGHSYLAGERLDNGDGAYDPGKDELVMGANGKPLTVSFTTK